jgi:hypothetical protein
MFSLAPVRQEICHNRWKKSTKPLESKKREISLGTLTAFVFRSFQPQLYRTVIRIILSRYSNSENYKIVVDHDDLSVFISYLRVDRV